MAVLPPDVEVAPPVQKGAEEVFADYRIVKELSRGRLGILYHAKAPEGDEVLLRVVAQPMPTTHPILHRVLADLDLLEQIEHPNVSRILSRGVERGHTYFTLTYPGKTTLLRLIRQARPLAGAEVVWLGCGLVSGISAMHALGLPHGDLWPGKVAIRPQGPLIVELGWSMRLKDPERKVEAVDFENDLLGLATSLVYAASGHLPRGKKASPPLPDSWDPDTIGLPGQLIELVEALLQSPENRPSLAEVVNTFDLAAGEFELDDPATSLESFFGCLVQMGEPPSTAVLEPIRSESDETVRETISMDPDRPFGSVPLRRPSQRTKRPPSSHVLREGLEVQQMKVLGQGGMGIVHQVLDPVLGRRAALKLVLAGGTPTRLRRFQRETKVTARLDHPGIPAVYEAGRTIEGEEYLLMQVVDGLSLHEVLRERWIDSSDEEPEKRDLLHALVKVADAVAYSHSRRVVHRDLKPANIMLGSFGEVFVMDWGLARDLRETSEEDVETCSALGSVDDFSDITQEGMVLGTLGYIPPEQAVGDDVDARADVFALGAILCEVLTGRPPVVGQTAVEVLGLTRSRQIETPRQRNQNISPELDAIACRALAPDADARYETALEFAADLRAYLEGDTVSAYSYGFTELVLRFAQRHRTLTVALGVAAALSVVAALLTVQSRQAAAEERHRECLQLVSQGETALREGRAADARESFMKALVLEPTNSHGVIGRHKAAELERGLRSQREEAERRDRESEQAERLVTLGEMHLANDDLDGARRAFEQAALLEAAPPEAADGLMRVKVLIAQRDALERERLQKARDVDLARRHVEQGREHLEGKKRDYSAARVAFIKALAFGSKGARELLLKTEERLLEERLEARKQGLRRDAAKLVKKAITAKNNGRYNASKTAFLQALAFDGGNRDAQSGLVKVDRLLRAREENQDRQERSRAAHAKANFARESADKGEALLRQGGKPGKVREAYFASLVAFDQALALVPDHDLIRREKLEVVREVAELLRNDGQAEFADFLLRYSGLKPKKPVRGMEDPNLEILEADRVNLENAFGGSVSFEPTKGFKTLRRYLASLEDRYRVMVQVRSQTTESNPPQVTATGVWVRVEDRQTRIVYPMVKIRFEGGPYMRTVRVAGPGRRLIGPFNRAHGLDAATWEGEVERVVRGIIKPDKSE